MNNLNFPFVDAADCPESIPRYAKNPFVEALAAVPQDRALQPTLRRMPAFDASERMLPAHVRMQRLDTLQSFFVPLLRGVLLAHAAQKQMHTGYGARRPLSAEANRTMRELSLMGASGCGKSFSLRQITAQFPPPISYEVPLTKPLITESTTRAASARPTRT